MKKSWAICAGLALCLTGCVVVPAGPGEKPADQPPQIVASKDDTEKRLWDDSSAFGPVPANLQVKGDAICQKATFERAIGYHPLAKDYNGQTIPGGGYLCEGDKSKKTQ